MKIKINYKKSFCLLATLLLFSAPSFAEKQNLDTQIDNVDLTKYFPQYYKKEKSNDKKEIEKIIKQLKAYSETKNLDGIKKILSDTFISNDGFNKEKTLDVFQNIWSEYPDLRQCYKIKEISVDKTWAKVLLEEKAVAKLNQAGDSINRNGYARIESEYILYFQKYGADWKIQSEYILNENAVITYGDARFMEITLDVPTLVEANSDYAAKIEVKAPEDAIVFASLDNEKIELNRKLNDNIFKTLTDDGKLERMLRANNEDKNETLVASVGIATPQIIKNKDISVKISGMALVMRRVNVINQKQDFEEQN